MAHKGDAPEGHTFANLEEYRESRENATEESSALDPGPSNDEVLSAT